MAGPSERAGLECEATAEAPVGHPVAGPESLTAALIGQRVLALQRTAGNSAVAGLLGRYGVAGLAPPRTRSLARQPTPTLPKAPASPPAACGTEWRPPTDPARFLEFRGEIEHFIAQMDFMTRPGARAEYSIPGASKSGSGRTGYADAVDTVTNEIWEIKPEHLQSLAVTEAERYVTYADAACAPRNWKPGTSYSPKTDPLWPPAGVVDVGFRLRARQGNAGAILYKWEFDKELLEAFALSLLIKFAARAIKDAVFGKDSAVDPGKVPAFTYAPYQVTAIAPGLREFTGTINKELARRFGKGPKGFGLSISVPQSVYVPTTGQVLMADKLKSMGVQTDPDLEMARALTLALGAAGALFGLPFGLYGIYRVAAGARVVVALALEAAPGAFPAAASEGVPALGTAARGFLRLASAAAPAGGLVFGVMSKEAYAAGKPTIDLVTPTYQWIPGGGSGQFGQEVPTPQGTRYLIGAAEA